MMWIGWLQVDARLGDVHTLKQKRAVVRPVVAELLKLTVSAAEVDHVGLYRRLGLGVAVTASDHAHVVERLSAAEAVIDRHPELEVLSVQRREIRADDL